MAHVDSWITALTRAVEGTYRPLPHWGTRRRVTWPARGSGRPGHEPNEPGKTDRPPTRGAQHDDAGSGIRLQTRAYPREECLSRQREPLPTRVEGLPPLPAAYTDALDAGLAELDFPLPPVARQAIDDHVRLLLAWTGSINLTSIRDPADVARLHVLDSLTAVIPLRQRRIARFVDLGSGGGLPGIPLAAALPADRVVLVESVRKKVGFLDVAVRALGLTGRVAVEPQRVEAMARDPRDRERWPAVTARAVAALAELAELAFPLLAPGGVLVAWKRGAIEAEIGDAVAILDALGGGRIEVVDPGLSGLPGHRLVIVEKTGRTGDAWPRDPAVRRRPR
jgi:16S rRNA (guanine527-N7)-methyltransferase